MSKPLDVMIVNPGGRKDTYQRMADHTAIETPVWAGLIATYLRTKGKGVGLMDLNVLEYQGYNQVQAACSIVGAEPRLVAVVVYGHNPSATTQTMPAAGKFCRILKEISPNMPIVMVGGHVAALPARTLQEEACDFVCQGEGPVSILELVEALTAGNDQYKKVGDLWYREGGKPFDTTQGKPVFSGRRSHLVWNLDQEMDGMAYDLFPMDLYKAHDWHCNFNEDARQPYASMYTTLGCPYHCDFCNIQLPFRSGERLKSEERTIGKRLPLNVQQNASANSYRRWSPQTVVAWVDRLVKEYGIKNIKFADELFVQHKAHVTSICKMLAERKYDLNIWCYARPDSVNDMQDDLKNAGINWVCLGIEGGNVQSRMNVDKKFDQQSIYKVVGLLKNAGIHVLANYIFGLPDDDLTAMQQTYDLAVDLDAPSSNFYSCMALPGTALYNNAIAGGLKLPDSWAGFSQYSYECLPMPTKHLSGEEVLWFRDEAWFRYFNDPSYLSKVERLFGPEAVAYVKTYASQKSVRKYTRKPKGCQW